MYSGKYIFSQILDFVDKYEFEKCVKRHNGDFRTRDLTCCNQFVRLFFGQITSLNSLRNIYLCLKAYRHKLYHLGIKQKPYSKFFLVTDGKYHDSNVLDLITFSPNAICIYWFWGIISYTQGWFLLRYKSKKYAEIRNCRARFKHWPKNRFASR